MRKVYYIYNPQTQTYDRIYPTVRQRMVSLLRRLFIGMGLGAGSFIILLIIFGSPSEKELRKENSQLLAQYNVLSRRLDEAMGVLQDVQQRDDNLYRVIFAADPVPSMMWWICVRAMTKCCVVSPLSSLFPIKTFAKQLPVTERVSTLFTELQNSMQVWTSRHLWVRMFMPQEMVR